MSTETVARTPEDNMFLNHIGDACALPLCAPDRACPTLSWLLAIAVPSMSPPHNCQTPKRSRSQKGGVRHVCSRRLPCMAIQGCNKGAWGLRLACEQGRVACRQRSFSDGLKHAHGWHRVIEQGQTWGRGLVTLIGDAAYPTTPALGQGGCMALEVGRPRPFTLSPHNSMRRAWRLSLGDAAWAQRGPSS